MAENLSARLNHWFSWQGG